MFAAALGMILAALFAVLLTTSRVSEADIRKSDSTHYAAPAEPATTERTGVLGIANDRASLIGW